MHLFYQRDLSGWQCLHGPCQFASGYCHAPCLELGLDKNAGTQRFADKKFMLNVHKFCISKLDACADNNLVEKSDWPDESNLLLNIDPCTTSAAHACKQTAAQTEIQLCRFGKLQVPVTLEDASAHVKRGHPESAQTACQHDGWITLEKAAIRVNKLRQKPDINAK